MALTSQPFLTSQASQLTQTVPGNLPRDIPPQILPRDPIPPDTAPLPATPPSPLPPPDQLLQPPGPTLVVPEILPDAAAQTVFVEGFRVEGGTVFDPDALADLAWWVALNPDQPLPQPLIHPLRGKHCPENLLQSSAGSQTQSTKTTDTENTHVAASETGRELSFERLLRARAAITQLYIECGYLTSGAILRPQTPEDQDNIVIFEMIEGSLEDIEVTGLGRLNPDYIRSRLDLATPPPLNREELVEGLQLLQLNPLVRRISADLQTGTRPANNILQVEVIEADAAKVELDLNNNRSPSVGSFERGITFNHANLSGLGDRFSVTYNNTEGSNQIQGSYTLPVSPRNATIGLRAGYTSNNVVESPFDDLEINAESYFYEATFRHPIFQKPTEELFLGLTLSHQSTQTKLGINDLGPFQLSPEADSDGRTRVSAIRFTQEWIKRNPRQIFAANSQFSLGLDLLDSTINDNLPDSRFFSWRGQGQWVQLLNDQGLLLLLRTGVQLTGDSLLSMEQFSLGGQDTVRGYRQDEVLTDNGLYASAEARWPVLTVRDRQGVLYLTPFLDVGTGWNTDSSTNQDDDTTLLGTGMGLLWTMGDELTARLDWGIPLISVDARERTWQESGIYFSIKFSSF